MCGENVVLCDAFLGAENLPRIADLFLGFPFWELGTSKMGIVRLSGSE
jgi:hypothetical protein